MNHTNRRDLLRLTGGALWVGLASACAAGAERATGPAAKPAPPEAPQPDGFLMFQISDTHWGYKGVSNPEAGAAFERTVAEIARWPIRPHLVVHTGDVTHMTPDAGERTARLETAKAMLAKLGTELLVIPGEHDAAADRGEAFQRVFGQTHQARTLRGVSMIAIDNASDPKGAIGDDQLAWLEREVAKAPRDRPLLVFAHRPLFPLAQPWDWFTQDGERALEILDGHPSATVFYGHIHQAHIHKTRTTLHLATRSLVFPMPAPMSVEKKAPLTWSVEALDHGLGYRGIAIEGAQATWLDRPLVS